METKGLVHIYFGDGKGKTTAAAGLAARCAGGGGKVLFFQFMKDGTSGEINALRQIKGIEIGEFYQNTKFTYAMTDEEKDDAKKFYSLAFDDIVKKSVGNNYDLIVLDEVLHAVKAGYIDKSRLIDFMKDKPYGSELVLTGKEADRELCAEADYVSDIIKIKHPFDLGVAARKLIEK